MPGIEKSAISKTDGKPLEYKLSPLTSMMQGKPSIEIITTADGSNSLFRKDLGEHYHSTFGAIQESEHIFIAAGLNHALTRYSELNILEIGFGTGLNAWLTLQHTPKNCLVKYHGVEAFPPDFELISQLNYADETKEKKHLFLSLHTAPWEKLVPITSNFSLHKIHSRAENMEFPSDFFHLVYFDAFAPQYEPCLWTAEIFKALFNTLQQGGLLVTYCCKGEVKRKLKDAGFSICKLPGPKGKREFLRAEKPLFPSHDAQITNPEREEIQEKTVKYPAK